MSLRARLSLFVTALTLALLGGLGLYLGGSLDAWTAEVLDQELLRRAREIAARLEVEDDGELEIEGGDDDAPGGGPILVENARGEVLLGRRGEVLATRSVATATGTFESARSSDGSVWRVLSRPVEPEHARRLHDDERPLVLRIAEPVRGFSALNDRFRAGLLLALALGALLGAGGAFVLATVVLAPLRRLSREIAAVDESSLQRRVTTTGLAPELAALAAAFNGVLARLQGSFERQRQFVSRASHALRTPLAAVLAQAEVAMRRERPSAEYQEALADIAEAARESASLVDGLLALSRADEAAAAAPTEPVPLHEIAEELRRLFAERASAAGLSLRFEVPVDVSVRADRARLREALDALVDNAVRYTPSGGQVGVRVTRRPGDVIELEVWDSGVGLTDDDRAHAFERFFRGTAADTAHQPGSGLGLALVRAIADAHDAEVLLEPREGGGTRALLRWPSA